MPSSVVPRTAAVAAVVSAALAAGLLAGSSASADASADADVRIHDIQGSTRISPLAGRQVTEVPGIVTGVRTYGSKGFWFQDPQADADSATSEGVFVFTSSNPAVAVGDAVKVSGLVGEYIPGGTSSGNQSVTQISKPTVTVVSSGNALPATVTITARSVPARTRPTVTPRLPTASTAWLLSRARTRWTTTSRWRARTSASAPPASSARPTRTPNCG